ncbi:hypothetical protein AN1V17_50900 [Vallitalea sediminicola]
MLKNWTSHAVYQLFISHAVSSLNESQLKKFSYYSHSLAKLTSLNLDPLADFLAPYYSTTGRPAINQPEIFRSIILMLDRHVTSLTKWVHLLKSDDLLALLIGCTTDSLPPLGSYYDFINRLWLRNPSLDKSEQKQLYNYPKNSKPRKKGPGKNKKLLNKHPNIVRKTVDFFMAGRFFSLRYERLLQELFALIAIIPSMELGLISSECLTVAGDGTCVHCHSSSLGNKVCKCKENGDYYCKCPRHYSDIDASYGWDSDLGTWFYGHTLYAFSTYDSMTKSDLPLLFRFVSAKRHDSVTGVVALAELREVAPYLSINNVCFDSANDNYPTYELCNSWHYIPFIDLNSNRGKPTTLPPALSINEQGVPLCLSGHEMVYNGFCKNRSRHKWRCPLKCKKVDTCTCKEQCSPSPYGRVIYTKPDWDIRLFPSVPRGTKQWKDIYKTRTCSERINNRILNDYGLHSMRIRGKKRYSFFTMMIGINIHLDARIKKANLATS